MDDGMNFKKGDYYESQKIKREINQDLYCQILEIGFEFLQFE